MLSADVLTRSSRALVQCEMSVQAHTHLLLGIGPARDLHNHVEHGLLLIGVQWDVVEGRDRHAILFNVDAVLEGVWCADLANGVCGGGS